MEIEMKRTIESLTKEYCLEEKENQKTNLLNIILIKIKNDNTAFIELIKYTREYLSSTKDLIRISSMTLILRILERVANLKLDFAFYKSLIDLGFNKMKDVVIAGIAVKIIYNVLLKWKSTFPSTLFTNDQIINEHASEINQTINKTFESFSAENFNVPAYPLETRNYSYLIFEFLLENLEEFYIKRITDYLQLVVDAIDGEKDPRNILKMFSLITKISKRYFSDMQKYKDLCDQETMQGLCKSYFDTLEVYYPIEFSQPKNSPDKITASDLINALNDCFASSDKFMEYLIEVLQEKFSTTSSEAKIEALKTIRSVNYSYSRATMNGYLITLINLILNEVLNNDEELLHIDSLITFKDLIKKYYEDKGFNNDDIYLKKEEDIKITENIENNILKIFEKCEGLIFNSETVKNSYDAKDILVIVTEYNPQLRLKALQISIKLISHFLNDNKNYYLKNSNTILFYSLKNFSLEKAENYANKLLNNISADNQNNIPLDINLPNANACLNLNEAKIDKKEESEIKSNLEILNYFKSNIQIFKNLFYSLLKRDFSNNAKAEEIVFISELISNFLIKTETLIFAESEIKSIFDFIFNVWKTSDEDTENSLSTCIVALTNKFEFLENYKTINLFFKTKINYLLKMLRNKLEQIKNKNNCGHLCSECLCDNNDKNNKDCCKNKIHLPEKFKLDSSEFNYKEINKYLNLFIKFFTVEKISTFVLQEYFDIYITIKSNLIYFYEKLNEKFYFEADKIYNKINDNNADMESETNKIVSDFPNDNDISMEISQAEFKNLQIKEEEKIYNLIILLYKNIAENIQRIINQNIQILNLKTANADKSDNSNKSKKASCCGGKNKKTKSQSSGCCSSGKAKAVKSGCCGGAKQSQDESDSDADNKLIKIEEEEEEEEKKLQKSCKKTGGKCHKNKKAKTAEEENSEIILKNNSKIIFDGIKNLINLQNLNLNPCDDDKNNVKIKSESLVFFFEIYDDEIFHTTLAIIEDYLNSGFIDKEKKSELVILIINIFKNLNINLLESKKLNKNEMNKIIKYFFILFDANLFNRRSTDNIINDPEFKSYFNKIKKSFFIKFLFKIIKNLLNTKFEKSLKSFNNAKHQHKIKNILQKTEQDLRLEISLADETQALSLIIKNVIVNEIANVCYEITPNRTKYFENSNDFAKNYFSYIYMFSTESELINKFTEGNAVTVNNINKSNNLSSSNIKITNLTEDEKQNMLLFSYKNIQKENFKKQFSSFNFNFYKTLIHFTKLNKLAYKLNGFLYYSLYSSLKNYSELKMRLDTYSVKAQDKMDIEETSFNNLTTNNDTKDNFLNLIQNKLKNIYDDFLTSFEKVLAMNRNFKNLIISNFNNDASEDDLNINIFGDLDAMIKITNFINFIGLINDKNVLEILNKLMEKLFMLSSNLRDLQIYLKKENLATNSNLLNYYFSNACLLKLLNGSLNFDNMNNPFIANISELTKEKIKVNFLKFNKNIYEKSFDKNNIYDYLLLFKKNSENETMQYDKNTDSQNKDKFDLIELNVNKAKTEENNFWSEIMKKAFNNAYATSSDINFYKSLMAKFILNFYLNFDFETLQEHIDIILDHTLKFLSEGLCSEKAAKSLKNIIQYVGKNFLQKKGYNLQNIIENLVKVLNTTHNLELKEDVLYIIYKIIQISKFSNGDNKFLRKISAKLKNLLNNRKRTIRKYAGLCINLLSLKYDE